MDDIVWPLVALVGVAALLYKLRDLRREPASGPLRLICVMLACMTVTAALGSPTAYVAFDRALGVPNLSALAMNACGMGFVLAVQRLLLHWVYPAERARRRAQWWQSFYILAFVAQVVLFALAPVDTEEPWFIGRYAATPFAREFMVMVDVCLLFTLIDIARLCWRYAAVAGRSFLRVGLRCTGIGAMVSIAYFPVELAYVLGRSAGVTLLPDGVLARVYTAMGFCSSLLVAGGLTIPAWGPRIAEARAWMGRYRAYRGLHRLWLALYHANPHIALDAPTATNDPLWIDDLDYRLVRRVVEIRDGRLALRPYLSTATAEHARRAGERAGLHGTALEAAVEAATIADAIRAQRERRESTDPYLYEAPGGADLASETAWLGQVCRAMRETQAYVEDRKVLNAR